MRNREISGSFLSDGNENCVAKPSMQALDGLARKVNLGARGTSGDALVPRTGDGRYQAMAFGVCRMWANGPRWSGMTQIGRGA